MELGSDQSHQERIMRTSGAHYGSLVARASRPPAPLLASPEIPGLSRSEPPTEPPTSPGLLEQDTLALRLAANLVTTFQFQSQCRIQVDGRTRHERTVVTKTPLRFPRLSKI